MHKVLINYMKVNFRLNYDNVTIGLDDIRRTYKYKGKIIS